jgi:hypothetical protein
MATPIPRRPAAALLAGTLLAGCALFTVDTRTTDGPTAEDIWRVRFEETNARRPSFAEEQRFTEELDGRVREFLDRHPELASSYRVGTFRHFRQAALGMTKAEVRLLLGDPREVTADPARMEALARRFWPTVKEKAKEAWVYPAGWTLYFDGDALADITRYHRAFLHP